MRPFEMSSGNFNPTSSSEIDAVVKTVEKYINGIKTANIETLKQAFYPSATMHGYIGDDLSAGPIDPLFALIEACGPMDGLKSRIDVLDITGTTAVVRVTMEHADHDRDYTDFHTLYKQREGGSWRIIAKVFHLYDRV